MSLVEGAIPRVASAFAAGLLFGLGLAVSGMTNPGKVRDFLDVSGEWDPALALVMAAAVAVTYAGYRVVRRRERPYLDAKFHVPGRNDVDAALVAGAAVFGIGWGLGGFCPGPAVAALAWGSTDALLFVIAMAVGMGAADAWRGS